MTNSTFFPYFYCHNHDVAEMSIHKSSALEFNSQNDNTFFKESQEKKKTHENRSAHNYIYIYIWFKVRKILKKCLSTDFVCM